MERHEDRVKHPLDRAAISPGHYLKTPCVFISCRSVGLLAHLLSSVDDILSIGQTIDAGPANDRVVARGGVGHFHGTELQEGLAQCDSAEQHLPARRRWDMTVRHSYMHNMAHLPNSSMQF